MHDAYSEDSIVWRNLINAIMLEMGILPILTPTRESYSLGEIKIKEALDKLPTEERRQLTRKFRKLRRQVMRHSKRPCHSSARHAINILCESSAMTNFRQIAELFDDTRRAARNPAKFVFNDDHAKILLQAYDAACKRLKGEEK